MRNVLNAAVDGGAITTNPGRPGEGAADHAARGARVPDARPGRSPRRRRDQPAPPNTPSAAPLSRVRPTGPASLRTPGYARAKSRRSAPDASTFSGAVSMWSRPRRRPAAGCTSARQRTTNAGAVPLPGFLIEELTTLLAGRAKDDLVFGAPEGGPLRHGNFYVRHFKPAVVRAGLPPATRYHDLRHTYASRLIAEAPTALTVMRRLDHSSIKVTYDTYGHLLPEHEEALTDRLDAIARAARPTLSAPVVVLDGSPRKRRSATRAARQ